MRPERFLKPWVLELTFAFLLILAWPCGYWWSLADLQAQSVSSSFPEKSVALQFFGLHIEHADSSTAWPPVPFGSWRLWDTGASWVELEPHEGQWDFRSLDRDVTIAAEHNVSVLLTLGLTPSWASTRPTERGYSGPGSAAMPKNDADWRTYVRTVAARYKGRIHEYEIWNEPNFPHFFSGDVDQMLLLTREAAEILKDVDPSNVVVSPSPVTAKGIPWFEQFLKKGGGKYIDVVAYHFYVSPLSPEAMVPIIKRVRDLMIKYDVADKPLWNTETGWLIQNKRGTVGPWGPFRRVLSPGMAASYVGELTS